MVGEEGGEREGGEREGRMKGMGWGRRERGGKQRVGGRERKWEGREKGEERKEGRKKEGEMVNGIAKFPNRAHHPHAKVAVQH